MSLSYQRLYNRSMPSAAKRTFSLPAAQARYIDAKVRSGAYSSASEVVRAGLRALAERDAIIERWLKEDVVAAYDRHRVDPSRAVAAETVFAEIRNHHAAQQKIRNRRRA